MLSNLFRWHKLGLRVSVVCFVTTLVSLSVLGVPPTAYAKVLSIQQVKERSLNLYEHLNSEKRSQSEVDAAMQSQFGLQRLNVAHASIPLTSTSSDVDLPTPAIYRDQVHGVTFIYADFSWKTMPSLSDPMDYNDVFGIWFTQSLPVGATQLRVSEIADVHKVYNNAANYNQGGVDFVENANFWLSGDLEVSFNGDFPSGCTQIFSKYTHGWSSDDLTSTAITVGFPTTFGLQVTYSVTAHSWQTTGSQPAQYGCPGERPDPGM